MKSSRPRQKDVAKLAKVSPGIVSLVINDKLDGNVRISHETQQRVWAAVRQLGYVPNPVARGLRTGQNQLLGVFTYDAVFPMQAQSFYFPFLMGIEEEAEKQDYNLLFFTRPNGPGRTRSVYKDGANQLLMADGTIFIGTHEKREELARLLQEGFPFVYVGRREVDGGEMSYVAADYAAATADVVAHIANQGHRQYVYLRLAEDTEQSQDRERGYRLAHQRLGWSSNPQRILRLSPKEVTATLLQRLLSEGVTAIIVENHDLTRALLDSARALHKRPPEDFSLAMLGDPLSPDERLVKITKFKIPRREMGIEAVRLLTQMLHDGGASGPYRSTLGCTFVEGCTVASLVATQ